jgi:hypothetical protein
VAISSKVNAPDTLSITGVQLIANRINAFWRKQGVEANARPKPSLVRNEKIWAVRSDLQNGSGTKQ